MSRVVPDPGLTLAEVLHVMSCIYMETEAKQKQDAVLQSAWDKLRTASHHVAENYPDEFEDAQAQIAMEKRFGRRR